MKQRLLLLLATLCLTLQTAAQSPHANPADSTKDENKTYTLSECDSPARYPGGVPALTRFLSENIQYPPKALETGIQGTVQLRFRIDADGYLGKIIVEKSVSPECDDEAIRVVLRFPRFTPARINGKAVACWFTQPITFRLE